MGWGDKWLSQTEKQTIIYSWENIFPEINGVELNVDAADLAAGIAFTKVSLDKDDTLKIEHIERARVYLNKMPTHDPYTNPDSLIYYECKCGAILDPGTKSFASLNNHASEAGWKIRFSEKGYIPYCVKCGENVE